MPPKKRSTPRKTTNVKKTSDPAPMDPTIPETTQPVAASNHPRVAYALQTLVAEVHHLFPETPVEYSNVDGRNTALDATFDLTVLDSTDRQGFRDLLRLITSDERVAEVLTDEDQVLVSIRSNPRTQDSRETFSLNDAWMVMHDDGPLDGDGLDWGGSL